MLVVLFAMGLALIGSAFSEDVAFFLWTVGMVVGGIGCWMLGRRWNRIADVHRFCTLPLQIWGLIFAGIGLFLMQFAWMALRL